MPPRNDGAGCHRRKPVGWEPGTPAKLTYTLDDPALTPEPGDIIASPAGAAYLIREARRSPSIPGRFYLKVERLPYGSVELGEEGVWPCYWTPRSPRRR